MKQLLKKVRFLLQVTKDDKVIYEEEITSQKEGLLSFEAQNPDHMI